MASLGHRGTNGVDGHPGREDDAEGDEPQGEYLLVMEQLSEDFCNDLVHRSLIEALRCLSIPREIGSPSSPQVLVLPGLSARDRSSSVFPFASGDVSGQHCDLRSRLFCFFECLHTQIDETGAAFFINIFNILGSRKIAADLEGIFQEDDGSFREVRWEDDEFSIKLNGVVIMQLGGMDIEIGTEPE
jgi:hypothetical protein